MILQQSVIVTKTSLITKYVQYWTLKVSKENRHIPIDKINKIPTC